MKFINKIEINKHEIIKDRGKYFAECLNGDDRDKVLSIVNKSEQYLKTVGEQDNVVYAPTKRELATFTVSFKRYVRTDFIDEAISRINKVCATTKTIEKMCKDCKSKVTNEYPYIPDMACDGCEKIYDYYWNIQFLQYERERLIEREFDQALENTIVPDQLVGNWLLLMRKMREDKESKHIDNALKEFIRDELINEFSNQNKQLLKKYQLWQNQ